jgi:hypothetical protein
VGGNAAQKRLQAEGSVSARATASGSATYLLKGLAFAVVVKREHAANCEDSTREPAAQPHWPRDLRGAFAARVFAGGVAIPVASAASQWWSTG